jgi:hypothetical protein
VRARRLRFTSLLVLGIAGSACSDTASPDDRLSAEGTPALRDIMVSGPEDIPLEDGDSIPSEFLAPSSIHSTTLDADFESTYAYATASMRYFATHGKIELGLKLKKGLQTVDSASGYTSDDQFLPFMSTLYTPATVSLPGQCGYRLDAKVFFSAWMAFPLPKSGSLFSWGLRTESLSKPASQPECPPAPTWESWGGGYSASSWSSIWDPESEWMYEDTYDPYSGSCGLYQLWIVTVNDYVVEAWWERTDVDDEYCESVYIYV